MSESFSSLELLRALAAGDITEQGLLPWGSNYTFFALVKHQKQEVPAVYKPTRGERPLWDFPDHTLAQREVAAYVVSEALGWNFVPPTILRKTGPHGPGSLQFYVDADEEAHYFNLSEDEKPELRRVVLFDLLINNADRKGGHVIRDRAGKLWLIDHGLCFHTDPKLRTVIWDFAGEPIPQALRADLTRFRANLDNDQTLQAQLDCLLSEAELATLRQRADRLRKANLFPHPGAQRSYPWPPL